MMISFRFLTSTTGMGNWRKRDRSVVILLILATCRVARTISPFSSFVLSL